MYLDGAWHLLTPKAGILSEDVVESLDASILQNNVLAPILGIENPRTNDRIKVCWWHSWTTSTIYSRGSKGGVAFCMFLHQLLAVADANRLMTEELGLSRNCGAVADANRLMPPKRNTWFEPFFPNQTAQKQDSVKVVYSSPNKMHRLD